MRTTSRLALCAARGACAVCTGFVQTSNSAVCTVHEKAVDVCDLLTKFGTNEVEDRSRLLVGG